MAKTPQRPRLRDFPEYVKADRQLSEARTALAGVEAELPGLEEEAADETAAWRNPAQRHSTAAEAFLTGGPEALAEAKAATTATELLAEARENRAILARAVALAEQARARTLAEHSAQIAALCREEYDETVRAIVEPLMALARAQARHEALFADLERDGVQIGGLLRRVAGLGLGALTDPSSLVRATIREIEMTSSAHLPAIAEIPADQRWSPERVATETKRQEDAAAQSRRDRDARLKANPETYQEVTLTVRGPCGQ